MRRSYIRTGLVSLAIGALSCGAFAELSRPTISGSLVGFNSATGMVTIRTANGKILRGHMNKGARYKLGERSVGPGSFTKGMRVAIRVEGALNESPLQCDMLMDWMSSEKYVAKVAEAPYQTPMGSYPTTSGVAGKSPDQKETDLTKDPEKDLMMLAAGGKPYSKENKQLGEKANGSMPNGYYDNSTMPNDAVKMADPGGGPVPATVTAQLPGGAGPLVQPGMSPAEQIRMQQYQLAQQQAQMTRGTGAGNLMDPDGDSSEGSGPAGMGGPSAMSGNQMAMGGVPVNIVAQIVSSDLASRTLMVRANGAQAVQTVVVSPQAPIPALVAGQTVSIQGTSDPQGLITATSVMLVGH